MINLRGTHDRLTIEVCQYYKVGVNRVPQKEYFKIIFNIHYLLPLLLVSQILP